MVYFTERFLSGVRHPVVSSDRNQPREDELNFLVEKPWTGSFVDRWPRLDDNLILPRLSVEIPLSVGKTAWVLQSSIHNEAPNSDRALILGQRLIEGQTRWGAMTKPLCTLTIVMVMLFEHFVKHGVLRLILFILWRANYPFLYGTCGPLRVFPLREISTRKESPVLRN
ncbi:putative mitochondrial protein [Cucumis melo var. makuwa]|uniref:Mitochondrial protein n=1 Tax=Cucumis melo var. makuwa TaxID=1194695 RepID=A0A5D3CB18_CUCMM|nr:putative mitochondrial protein [Cucumis melo var. makuwa]TYK08685.1 putative mitochondrial protein [Cucumis melo var. makuwa]